MTETLVLITSGLLIISKFLDCLTTELRAAGRADKTAWERNPVGRKLMRMIGFHFAIWGVFALTVILAAGLAYVFIKSGDAVSLWGYILLGLIISLTQFDVARANYTGKASLFTKMLGSIYERKKIGG